MARRGEITQFSRDRRRPPRWNMGLPPRRPPGRLTRLVQRIVSPVFYLKAVIGLAVFGLLILPTLADLVNAAMKPVDGVDGTCRIIRVIDGDTVTLMCPEGGIENARLLGFDTPERFSPQCLDEFVAAEKATWALRTLIQRADRLTLSRDGVDRYGRALVRLELDSVDVARLMIREGHGRQYGGGLRGSWCA